MNFSYALLVILIIAFTSIIILSLSDIKERTSQIHKELDEIKILIIKKHLHKI